VVGAVDDHPPSADLVAGRVGAVAAVPLVKRTPDVAQARREDVCEVWEVWEV